MSRVANRYSGIGMGSVEKGGADQSQVEYMPIAEAANYYLKEDHTVSGKKELLTQAALFFVCISGTYLYFGPSAAYASRIGQSDLAWLYITSTCFPALAVLYVATDNFFKWHSSAIVPKPLKGPLKNPQTRAWRWTENFGIGTESLISSIPLAAIMYAYAPEDWSKAATIAYTLLVLFDNIILHFLPVKLVLNKWEYRLPVLPFEVLIKHLLGMLQTRKLDIDQKDLKRRQAAYDKQKTADIIKLKTAMRSRLSLAQQAIIQQSFKWNSCKLQYDIKVPEAIKALSASANISATLAAYVPEDGGKPYFKIPQRPDKLLSHFLEFIGAVWIWSCASGYYAAPYNQIMTLTEDSTAAALITMLPIYFMSALMTFFGREFIAGKKAGLYQYLTTWGPNITKIPMSVKLFPKTFVLLMALNACMVPFSYASAVELVYANFTYKWAQPFVPPLVNLAMTGISFVGFFATRKFYMLMFIKLATHLGGSEMRELAKITEKIDQYKTSINLMDDASFEKELAVMDSKQRCALLGMDDSDFAKVVDHPKNFEDSYCLSSSIFSHWYTCFTCMPSNDADGQRAPLVSPMAGVSA